MTQAILTKYLGPGRVKGSRIKAQCAAGSIIIPYPHEVHHSRRHAEAAKALVVKLSREAAKRNPGDSWGLGSWAQGDLPDSLPWGACFVHMSDYISLDEGFHVIEDDLAP